MATSPVPPNPLWQLVTMAASTGYIFRREAIKNPLSAMAMTIEPHTTT